MTDDDYKRLRIAAIVGTGIGAIFAIIFALLVLGIADSKSSSLLVVAILATFMGGGAVLGGLLFGAAPLLLTFLSERYENQASFLFERGPQICMWSALAVALVPPLLFVLTHGVRLIIPGCTNAKSGELAFTILTNCSVLGVDVSQALSGAYRLTLLGSIMGLGYAALPLLLIGVAWWFFRAILE